MSFYTNRPAVLPLRDSGAVVFELGLSREFFKPSEEGERE